jgi:hypothetical protein
MDRIQPAKYMDQRRALVKILINLGVPRNAGNFTSWTISISKVTPLNSINMNYKCHIMFIIWKVRATTTGESAGRRDKAVVTVYAILKQQKKTGLYPNLGLNNLQSSRSSAGSYTEAPPESVARGTPSVQNTGIFCGFFRTGFRASNRGQYFGFLLWDPGVTSLIIIGWWGAGGHRIAGYPRPVIYANVA